MRARAARLGNLDGRRIIIAPGLLGPIVRQNNETDIATATVLYADTLKL